MAVKVLSANLIPTPIWNTRKGGTYILANNEVMLLLLLQRNGTEVHTAVTFKKGFRCDGLSVPKMFQWFLPKWDDRNQLFNMAGALHDWLYATEGAYHLFSRSECDDIFRGILREAGLNRFHASAADWAVGVFAGGKSHWGNDDYCIGELARFEGAKGDNGATLA